MITDSVNQPGFTEAIIDYYFLLNKNYPEKSILKLIGDKYHLSGQLRNILHRGVWSGENNKNRQQRLVTDLSNQELIIDGYNVVFTVLNYKLGRPVFLSSDNICRDAGSLFGKIKKQEYFHQSIIQVIKTISILNPGFVQLFFDVPVSFSGEHKIITEKLFNDFNILGSIQLVKSADNEILKAGKGIICTSDSSIIDKSQNLIADIPLLVLQHYYNPDLLNLRILLEALQ